MANPFYVPPPDIGGGVDNLLQGFKQAQLNSARSQAAQAFSQGGDTRSALARLLSIGDVQGATALAHFGNNERDFAFKQQEAERSQGNTDRTYNEGVRQFNIGVQGGKVPAGFEPNPAGGLRPVAGGPQDPKYLQETRKPPQMSVSDIGKLTEEGGKFSNISGFMETFKPEYAGQPLGNLGNTITRNTPGWMTTEGDKDKASWWQGYDRYKNVVRNDLFGSALTTNEQAAFEKADINPAMPPELIKRNLEIQRKITETGIRRKADAMIAAGHDPNVIGKAYGINFGPAQPSAQPQPQQAPQAQQFREGQTATGPGGQKIRFQGGQWVPM